MVDGSRRYSTDLPQGRLEVPCKLFFCIATEEFCKKTEKMICDVLSLDRATHKVLVLTRAVEYQSSNQPTNMGKSEYPTSVVALAHEFTNVPRVEYQLSTS